jgi:predicted ribosome quality control (RQC) complex YloA/Tae2 family protein
MIMQVEIDTRKSLNENAATHYERSKKAKSKMTGLLKAIADTKRLISLEERKETDAFEDAVLKKKLVREKDWYEKFHWLKTSGVFLAIGGRDAKSNEMVVHKHLESKDLFFHADVHGAPAIVLKDGQKADEKDLEETAIFSVCYSRAWAAGKPADTYCVKPEQVKTAAKSGEYLSKGAFVITGERHWFKNITLKLFLGLSEGKLHSSVVQKPKFITIVPDTKLTKGESSKTIFRKLKELYPEAEFDVTWVQELLPNGGSRIVQ